MMSINMCHSNLPLPSLSTSILPLFSYMDMKRRINMCLFMPMLFQFSFPLLTCMDMKKVYSHMPFHVHALYHIY